MARATSRTAVESSSWTQALAWRMGRHHLVRRARPSRLLDVVADICGLHAQVMSSAELSLWARVDGLERGAVQELLWERRELVKLWAMRGTLHLLPARELGLWLSAFDRQRKYGNEGNEEVDVLTRAVARALDGRVLTREQLAQKVVQYTGSEEYGEFVRFSWGSYLKAASWRGLLCFAPSPDKNVRFTSPATWLPDTIERIDSDEALREMTRRFLRAYAPATPDILALWWGGYGPALGRKLLAEIETVEVDVEGLRTWVLRRDRAGLLAAKPPQAARLLPAFDPWVLGSSARRRASRSGAQATCLPRAGMDLSCGARERPNCRRLEAHAQGAADRRRDRAVRAATEVGARAGARPRPSAWPGSSAAS